MPKITELSNFANGAVNEEFNHNLQRAIDNIADPNTDPTKARKVTVTVTLKSDVKREEVNCEIQTKCTLVPAVPVSTKILVGHDNDGNVVGQELLSGVPGQTFITENLEVATDTGEVIEAIKNDGIIDFQKANNN